MITVLKMRVARILPLLILVGLPACSVNSEKNMEARSQMWGQCNACQFFEFVFNTINEWSIQTFNVTAPATRNLLIVGLAVWFVFRLLPFLGSIAPQDPWFFWRETNKTLFTGMVCAMFLVSKDTLLVLYGYTFAPLIVGILDFAVGLVDGSCVRSFVPDPNTAMPPSVGEMLSCTMENLIISLKRFKFLCIAVMMLHETNFAGFMAAFFAMVAAWFVGWVAPILVVDAVFRLGIAVALMPLFIAAWVFPSTQFFSRAGIKLVVNSGMYFVILALVIGMTTSAIEGVFDLGDMGDPAALSDPTDAQMETLREQAKIGGRAFLQILALSWIMCKLTLQTPALAQHFSSMSTQADSTQRKVQGALKTAGTAMQTHRPKSSGVGDTASMQQQQVN